ncbi:hypothetical protein ABVT39_009109 [Epinephelus coioides]
MHSEDSGSHFPTHPPNTFYRATSLHLLEAMAQFIHLLLLLGMCHVAATYVYERQVWLLEGSSATFPFPSLRTIKYCGRGGNKCECVSGRCKSNNASLPSDTVTDSTLTITNFTQENDEINLCYDTLKTECVHLNVSIGCSESGGITFAKGQPKHNKTTVADCRRLCTEDPTCQYFTFYIKTTCFLMTSRDDMLIQLHSYAVSGNNCAPVNSTSVPPGPTRPQHSDEEEEEEGLRFYLEHKSWIDALQHCHNKNSALVQITNQTVQDAVHSVLQNKSNLDGGVWIGLERSIFGVNVPWQWISGERVKETHWSSSAFVDPLNNHCGKVIQVEGSQEFKWLDEDCHKELLTVCCVSFMSCRSIMTTAWGSGNYKSHSTILLDIMFELILVLWATDFCIHCSLHLYSLSNN